MSSTSTEKLTVKSDETLRLNSMSFSVTIYWLLPMLCIAVVSRFAVDTGPTVLPQQSRPVTVNLNHGPSISNVPPQQRESLVTPSANEGTTKRRTKESEASMPYLSNKPYSYQEVSTVGMKG
jgi:hypothetical protein